MDPRMSDEWQPGKVPCLVNESRSRSLDLESKSKFQILVLKAKHKRITSQEYRTILVI